MFSAINEPIVMNDRETKRDFDELVLIGCDIVHMTLDDARKSKWGCDCKIAKTTP